MKSPRRSFPLALALVIPGLAAAKPNLVLILAHDMGYSDLGGYGAEIPTPVQTLVPKP